MVPFDALTIRLSVGSPTTTYGARKSVFAKALAPKEPVSSPLSSSRPNPSLPDAASLSQALYIEYICPLASHAPLPRTYSPSKDGAI